MSPPRIVDHAPSPGPMYWDGRCLRCDGLVSDHASWLDRLRWRRHRWEVVAMMSAGGVGPWVVPVSEGRHWRLTRIGAWLLARRWNRREAGIRSFGPPMRWKARRHR